MAAISRLPAPPPSVVEQPPPLLLEMQTGPLLVFWQRVPFGQLPQGLTVGVDGRRVGVGVSVGVPPETHSPLPSWQCSLALHEFSMQHTSLTQKPLLHSPPTEHS